MNKSQQRAIDYFKRLMKESFSGAGSFPIKNEITVVDTDYGCKWIRVQPDMPQLGDCNLLRALCRFDTWNVMVTRRGKLVVYACPKSCRQFAGKKAFLHLHFVKALAETSTSAAD